jgi:hypothetical protein
MATAIFSAVTGYIQNKPPTSVIFVLENSAFSRVKINVKRIVAQTDNISLVTGAGGVMPILRASRRTCTSSGGVLATKAPFDTNKTSNEGVYVRFSTQLTTDDAHDLAVTDTSEPTSWQQFTSRMVTAAEQHTSWDNSILTSLITTQNWVLYPGQCLVVDSVETTVSGGGTIFVQIVWEEDDSYDAGYTVSGVVNLDGSPVSGATVFLLQDLTTGMSAPILDVLTTNGSGQWSKTLASGVKAAAFVQHKNGSIMYTDHGKPYLEKP